MFYRLKFCREETGFSAAIYVIPTVPSSHAGSAGDIEFRHAYPRRYRTPCPIIPCGSKDPLRPIKVAGERRGGPHIHGMLNSNIKDCSACCGSRAKSQGWSISIVTDRNQIPLAFRQSCPDILMLEVRGNAANFELNSGVVVNRSTTIPGYSDGFVAPMCR
jgi:hypothetical protein